MKGPKHPYNCDIDNGRSKALGSLALNGAQQYICIKAFLMRFHFCLVARRIIKIILNYLKGLNR